LRSSAPAAATQFVICTFRLSSRAASSSFAQAACAGSVA
jgi:hypothetical protein